MEWYVTLLHKRTASSTPTMYVADVYVPTIDGERIVRTHGWVHAGRAVYKVVSVLQYCGTTAESTRIQFVVARKAAGDISLP